MSRLPIPRILSCNPAPMTFKEGKAVILRDWPRIETGIGNFEMPIGRCLCLLPRLLENSGFRPFVGRLLMIRTYSDLRSEREPRADLQVRKSRADGRLHLGSAQPSPSAWLGVVR